MWLWRDARSASKSCRVCGGGGPIEPGCAPGACAPPDDHSVVHTIAVELDHPLQWGHPVGYADGDAKKPTGLYLAPGQVANVTVPQAVVDAGGFKVQIGAQTHDHSQKSMHKRLDRVSVTFALQATSTAIVSLRQ